MGRVILPGNTVCYPVRRKSEMWLTELRVQQVEDKPPCLTGFNNEGRRITIKNVGNCVVVPPREVAA